MTTTTVQLKFPTHRIHIVHDDETHKIQCFKHDSSACDFDEFYDYDSASDYIMTPLPTFTYQVTTSDE